MAIPPWTVELLRRGLNDVARRAREPETLEKLKAQANEIIQELPQTAARGFDAVMRATEAGKKNVQRWSKKQIAIAIPLVNASGTLITPLGTGVPVAEDAVEAAYACLHGDVRNDHHAAQRLTRELHHHLDASAELEIAVAANFNAILTALVIGMSQEEILVHRSQAIRLRSGGSLVDALNSLVPIVQEVGANDAIEASDFDGFQSFCLILADDETQADAPKPLEFGRAEVTQVVVLPVATLKQTQDSKLPSVEAAIQAGADLVIVEGGGIFGGPECGLVIGKRALVQAITHSSLWKSLEATSPVQAMLVSTLGKYSSGQLPIDGLMQTSEENLRARAERLAMRLSASDSIKSCQVTAEDARITPKGRWRYPSRQIRVEHRTLSAKEWADQLREELPSLLVREDGQAIIVDLKWVTPASDGKIGELIGGLQSASENPASQPAS
ncbi:L-seryl-tRNA(Sec) selenium transferase [Novipirellula galeiformis]|uniref:L-seryl-tRNA(Sec) selenium transferase n=1 Tax=Novipirellula galeiformis TaxID=2528004 RepID=A0A5C6CDJ6_9BACT|nr:hypothetical protein [Novipirellula galeiformis]TWU21491.1 L-seryl-tRNA(Sec) selenium transferase [Novipirellula galeiformis]